QRGGAGGGFPGGAGGSGAKKAKDAKPGTPEHAADDFVAKMLAGDTKSAAKMVSSRARTPALKELLDGKAAKSSGQWKQVLQGANRLGAARSVRSDRVVNFTNSKEESIRMTLRRQGKEYKVFNITFSKASTKKKKRRSR
ncbi:MAG TPA: hypothetical protein DCE47_22395, partial [Planctomycetaceae bacterium]|nr:hypothetical protein [Planctomycetaceae bacterium]